MTDVETLPDVVSRRAGDDPDRPYLVEVGGRTMSYGAVRDESAEWCARFADLGVAPGDTVAVMLPTSALAVVVWLGLASCRAIEVPVNTALRARFLHHVLVDSRADVAVVSTRYLEQVLDVLDDVPRLRKIIVVGDAGAARDARLVPLADLPAPTITREESSEPLAPWDIATIMYTSGTTGASKGVLVPWAQIHATASGSMPFDELGPDDVFYAPFALFHVTGKSACYTAALFGGSVVLREQFSTDAYWNDVRTHGCTTTVLMGAMAQFLHRQPARDEDASTPLRNVLMAPLIPEVDAFCERFQLRVCTVFNMTEVSSPITTQGWELHDPQTCGRVREGYECRIVDEHDFEVPHGTAGELVVRASAPWVCMAGYWNNPEKTVEAWRNQWFHTGDLLRRDDAGNFTFVDRLKDAIRRRGENISSLELEAEVLEHPAVFEAAAFGVPSEWGEEEVMIVVVPRPGMSVAPDDLVAFLAPRIPRYMVPRYVEVAESLPKTPTEKVRKAMLRERGATAATWDREAPRPSRAGAG